jgi:hypothetical protein
MKMGLFVAIPIFVLLAGLALAALVFGSVHLMQGAFGRMSGLYALAERYPALGQPPAHVLARQWLKVGPVRYRAVADVGIGPEGLYLWVRPVLIRYPPALIPWSEFHRPQRTLLYWQRAVQWTIGDPPLTTIVVWQLLFEQMRPFLGPNPCVRL